jgi:ethanolaminephosphotransferase
MDGKQARKTGNSSPVGLLFDHGCDSFTTALLVMMMAKMMQIGNGSFLLWVLLAITQSFHFCTLEEYYIGGLFLGPLNGVTDGSAAVIAVFLATGIAGNDFWTNTASLPVLGTLTVSQIVVVALMASQFVACILK